MGERKAWTKEEDYALMDIIQVKKIKRWSDVSKVMETQYKIIGRTGKQCRQRWHNQLDPTIKNEEWTSDEEKILFANHDKFGNRWARISQQLQGRTDNCVKNHFYSTLRRSFRRLNRFIVEFKQRLRVKELKPTLLSKLVTAAEDRFGKKLKLAPEIIEKSVEIKNRLLPFSREVQNTPSDEIQMEKLVRQIYQFSKSYKRRRTKKSKQSQDQEEEEPFEEQSVFLRDETDGQQTPSCEQVPREKEQHKNLFIVRTSQLVREVSQVRSSVMPSEESKVMDEDYLPEIPFLKSGSTLSNWSSLVKLPSFHHYISEMSDKPLSCLDFNALGLELSLNPECMQLYGCNMQQLN